MESMEMLQDLINRGYDVVFVSSKCPEQCNAIMPCEQAKAFVSSATENYKSGVHCNADSAIIEVFEQVKNAKSE